MQMSNSKKKSSVYSFFSLGVSTDRDLLKTFFSVWDRKANIFAKILKATLFLSLTSYLPFMRKNDKLQNL